MKNVTLIGASGFVGTLTYTIKKSHKIAIY